MMVLDGRSRSYLFFLPPFTTQRQEGKADGLHANDNVLKDLGYQRKAVRLGEDGLLGPLLFLSAGEKKRFNSRELETTQI